MKVRDVMTQHVVTVHTDTSISDAVELLARHRITAMPVTEDGELVGMVSEADLLRDRIEQDSRAYTPRSRRDRGRREQPATVGEIMTAPAVAISAGADTADAAGLMLDYDVRSVPVVDGGQVTGIVSRRDLIRLLVRDNDDAISRRVQERLDDYAGEPDRWTVKVFEGAVTVTGDFADDDQRRVVGDLVRTVPGVTGVRTGPPAMAL